MDELNTLFRDPLEDGWARALAPLRDDFARIGEQLKERRSAGETILPAPENILRVFRQPFDEVKVLVLGQDPYPTIGHPIGMSFAVDKHVRPLPKSLQNIYRELHDDLGIVPPEHGDLSAWAQQGVMLLNTVLTVQAGAPKSHHGLGWDVITKAAVVALAERDKPLVSILWGADAGKFEPLLEQHGAPHFVRSPHPSPLSAYRGFFGSKPFSQTNALLADQGAGPIDWSLS
ncbi:uracil-DNA glycosylase [Micrococcoides hystricis]|uniref:Uracil-DNA glycosylase n=1 Tax=Micrococcoides hystricis TaxID=1572761 RepID=A0ABV6P9L5_9MICC